MRINDLMNNPIKKSNRISLEDNELKENLILNKIAKNFIYRFANKKNVSYFEITNNKLYQIDLK